MFGVQGWMLAATHWNSVWDIQQRFSFSVQVKSIHLIYMKENIELNPTQSNSSSIIRIPKAELENYNINQRNVWTCTVLDREFKYGMSYQCDRHINAAKGKLTISSRNSCDSVSWTWKYQTFGRQEDEPICIEMDAWGLTVSVHTAVC